MEHIGINVGDLEKSLGFYRDVLGFEQLDTIKYPTFSITYLRLPDGGRLELFEYGKRSDNREADETRIGYRHIAFNSDNVEAFEKHLIESGVKIVMSVIDLTELGAKCLLCEDPDGTVIEICKAL